MHPDIDERSAAGTFNVREPAAWIAETTNGGSLREVDLPKFTLVCKLAEHLSVRVVTSYEADLKQFAGRFNSFLYLKRFLNGTAERFLNQDVFARIQCRDADFRMCIVPSTDAYCIDFRISQKLVIIGVDFGSTVFSGTLCSFFI